MSENSLSGREGVLKPQSENEENLYSPRKDRLPLKNSGGNNTKKTRISQTIILL